MLGLGNALNKVKSLVPKVVNAGNKAVKTAVKKVADSALGRAVASIPSAVHTRAAQVGQITRKAVAAIPKIIEPIKKKAVEKAVQIKNSVTAKATQIKNTVTTAVGLANQAIVNKSVQAIKTVGQIQNAVDQKITEFNSEIQQKNQRIVEKMKAEWENTSSDLIKGIITTGAFPNYYSIRASSLLLDFMLKYRRSVIEEYPILELPIPVLRGPLNFIRSEITNKGSAAGSFIYKQKIPGLSDFVGELTDQRGPGAESNAFSVVGAGVRGVVVKGLLGTVDGIASLIEDPVAALEGINSIVAHPDETIPVICEGVKTFWNDKVVNGSPEDRAEVVGQAVFEVATWLVGVGEAKAGVTAGEAAVKSTKIARGAETVDDLSKINKLSKTSRLADGVDAATDTVKLVKSAESVIGKTTSKINKAWLKNLGKTTVESFDDAIIKTGKKTGDFIDNIRRGMKQYSNEPKLAFETVGDFDSLSSTGDVIADYYAHIKKSVKNKLDSTGNHNVNIKSKVEVEDLSKSIKKSGDGPGAIIEGTGQTGYDYLNKQLGGLKDKVEIKKYSSAESVNDWWASKGYDNPPYTPKTVVQEIKLKEDTVFVRVFDGETSGMYGGWVMKAEDIKGLTPVQIQDKFALPATPKSVAEVKLKAGDTIRMGEANPIFGSGGGGTQFDLMGQYIGEFNEIGNLTDWSLMK